MTLYPVILAGGSGTRLWPLSREYYPKQFLDLMGSLSMIQETALRLDGLEDVAAPIIVCNESHRFLATEQMKELDRSASTIILEPSGRNTGPALTLAALHILSGVGKDKVNDPVILAMPADHVIGNVQEFQSVVRQGLSLAQHGAIVTFGISPNSPTTAYGYIKKGKALDQAGNAFEMSGFTEKPDSYLAKKMVNSGTYAWNSGIFMMSASVWINTITLYRPDIATICETAYRKGKPDGEFYRPNASIFKSCPNDSIDYAVMEKIVRSDHRDSHENPVVLDMNVGWSDIGSWSTLWQQGERDREGNISQGTVYLRSVRNSLVFSKNRLVAAVGLDNVIVVETPDAVLLANRENVQDIKELVDQLKTDGRKEHENHRKVHRPWGSYETIDYGPEFQVKRLTINPGAALSLQIHHRRAEHWVVVKGTAKVTRDDDVFLLKENQSAYVPVGIKHRLENPNDSILEIIEVQSGPYLGEDDIVRLDDKYNRHI